ncbi:nuclear transport factor 2 family protein [Halobaculum magnesiiphilum]|uniref:Nuclear transport factor 2 family protein n=1 Tax=Halobaculum magnesiiphilum TaxID=1017351 RepID=A0A8T8WDQ3_9EURY|nr:nuclear transport factor 2 family protein [Halobaculum magnesiiphilum]QZP37906.1 nuclear transport factor 2 family protein [Halobaculum magnesiiphilum]
MTPEETVRAYYDALRAGEALAPFFVESPATVKVGISERLVGYAEIAKGLREQSRTTEDWTVESHDLDIVERDAAAAVSDAVSLSWYDAEAFAERSFETRWSGTLVPTDDGWAFAGLHVSAPTDLDSGVDR